MRALCSQRSWVSALVVLAAAASLLGAPTGAISAASHVGNARRSTRPILETLTHWRRVGYWAHAKVRIPVHARPTIASPRVAKLHFKTEEGLPEVYLVLSRLVTRNGRTWLKIAIPMRPNGSTGWVVHGALGKLTRVNRWLAIDRSRLRARFYDHGRFIWSAPVGIGKPSTPTPNGLFWVREEFVVRNQPFFGPYAFGTSAYSSLTDWPGGGVVGVHGTSLPQLVPGRPSHGCVRLRNRDILWLAYHMRIGTPISVVQ